VCRILVSKTSPGQTKQKKKKKIKSPRDVSQKSFKRGYYQGMRKHYILIKVGIKKRENERKEGGISIRCQVYLQRKTDEMKDRVL